jgi:dTDP-glucose 4,6-dehydratase
MTIAEASKLTIYAGAIGAPGEVLILDMGDPVRIFDVAQRFATLHDPPIEIEFTGLRPNEKLHEDLISASERGERRVHPLITHVAVEPLAPMPVMLGGPVPTFDEVRGIALSGVSGTVDA